MTEVIWMIGIAYHEYPLEKKKWIVYKDSKNLSEFHPQLVCGGLNCDCTHRGHAF